MGVGTYQITRVNTSSESEIQLYGNYSNKFIIDNLSTEGGWMRKADLAAAIGLTPDKIAKGQTILGITGTYEGVMTENDYNDAVTTANDILGNG